MIEQRATRARVQRELARAESLRLLASVSLGRVVFTHQALPAIRPVNHVVAGEEILIRSHSGAAVLAAAQRRVVVAYEADELDPVDQLGWSVVVTGVARPVPAELAGHYPRLPAPWVERSMDQLIAITTDIVTGFRLAPAPTSG